MIRFRLMAAVSVLLVAACANGPEQAPAPEPKPEACARSGALIDLEAMRDAITTSMGYPLGGGVSAESVFDGLRGQAEAAATKEQHLRVLEAYVFALGDHHAHLSTNDGKSPRLVPTGASVWLEWRGGQLVVTEMRPGAISQLREGMVIEKIDGVPTKEALKSPPATPERVDSMMGFAGRVALAGTREHIPTVTVRGSDHSEIETIPPAAGAPQNGDAPATLNFPRSDVAVIRLNNSIGNSELNPVFDELMRKAKGAKTLILDLRDTPSGGDSSVAKPLMAWFVDGTRGYQRHERGDRSWVEQVEGRKDRYAGRLIVLVDHWTGSMGEGAAIGLRAAAGATLVGTPMAGLRGAIEGFDLPCLGVSVRLPVERLFEVNGGPRELAMPDVLISEGELAARRVGPGSDVILERALLLAQ